MSENGKDVPPLTARQLKGFWRKVDRRQEGECWPWLGCVKRYGLLTLDGHSFRAHRVSYSLAKGAIPAGRVVMHTCDKPICVNPAHLKLGTQRDNMADCAIKDRLARLRGEDAGTAKLSEVQVREIRALLCTGLSCAKIGARFGVAEMTIAAIKLGKTWTHVV